MTVTSITAVAVSFRVVTRDASHAKALARKPAGPPAKDSVELSQQAVAAARTAEPSTR